MKHEIKIYIGLLTLIISTQVLAQSKERLIIPILLENEQRLDGNPLATYQAMLDKEGQYLETPLSKIFMEQKLNMEQFMGIPDAGQRAMNLEHLRRSYGQNGKSIPVNFIPKSAISVIEEMGAKHQIIIWGEEHHLPETRALYKDILEKLWDQGFRYLAAETFSPEIEKKGIEIISTRSGYYLQDPVYADAVRFAIAKGYQLISYDNNELERDKVQAENIYNKVFKKDSLAKVFIIAGRAHIVEQVTSQNWKPMGYWIKQLTGLDPFTIFTPTMSSRLTEDEHHPLYKYAVENSLVNEITIFKDSTNNKFLGDENAFDAYAFFPPAKLSHGRPDWMFYLLDRNAFKIPKDFTSTLPILIQAYRINEPENSIPVDQLLILKNKEENFLALPGGEFKIRSINSKGDVLVEKSIIIEN